MGDLGRAFLVYDPLRPPVLSLPKSPADASYDGSAKSGSRELFLDRSWNPGRYVEASARTRRMRHIPITEGGLG